MLKVLTRCKPIERRQFSVETQNFTSSFSSVQPKSTLKAVRPSVRLRTLVGGHNNYILGPFCQHQASKA